MSHSRFFALFVILANAKELYFEPFEILRSFCHPKQIRRTCIFSPLKFFTVLGYHRMTIITQSSAFIADRYILRLLLWISNTKLILFLFLQVLFFYILMFFSLFYPVSRSSIQKDHEVRKRYGAMGLDTAVFLFFPQF